MGVAPAWISSHSREEAASAGPGRDPRPEGAAPASLAEVEDAERRVAIEDPTQGGAGAPPSSPAAASAGPRASLEVRGRAFDPTGRPFAGLAVCAPEAGDARASCAPDGTFAIELEADRLPVELAPAEAGVVAVRSTQVWEAGKDDEHVLIAAPSVAISGVVRDEAGAPVEGAELALRVPISSLAAVPAPLDTTAERAWTTSSDAGGEFRFDAVPGALPRVELRASSPGFREAVLALATEIGSPTGGLVIVLERDRDARARVWGWVLRPSGEAAAGATVLFGAARAEADADGRFELVVEDQEVEPELPLVAVAPAHGPAVVGGFGARVREGLDAGTRDLGPILVELSGPALAISGRVIGWEGEPRAGWLVYLLDPTLVQMGGSYPPLTAESLAGSRGFEAVTGTAGTFELSGLRDRPYLLEALDPETAVRVQAGPFPAGRTGVLIRVPREAMLPRLRGRVLSRGGKPVAGARVAVLSPLQIGGQSRGAFANGRSSLTDPQGRFEIERVPRDGLTLSLSGDSIEPTFFAPEPGDEEVEITVRALCRMQIEGARGAFPADAFQVLDESGEVLPIVSYLPDGSSLGHETWALEGGSSPVLAVPEDAATLVFLSARGQELERRRLTLELGRTTVVHP